MEQVRNLYKGEVDFQALALQSADFAKHLKPNKQIDFNDPAAVRQLTVSLLQQDFGLTVKLPDDRLCPPVPNRLNYIIWLQDLLDSSAQTIHGRYDPDRNVVGLDIGTGCCSIYPLLGCKTRPRWSFVATDVDENNLRTAKHNVELNHLEPRIRIVRTTPNAPLIPMETLSQERFDFSMCNPPFYSSHEELVASANAKIQQPSSVCTGSDVEMVTAGGEVAFVTRMIDESLRLQHQVQWYTSMLGKLSSVSALVEVLIKHHNHNYAITEFVQGNKTKRWAIAWSWNSWRPSMASARGIPGFPKHLLPFPSEFTFALTPERSIDWASATLNKEMSSLPWYWDWDPNLTAGIGFAAQNVWSRQARRKLKLDGSEGASARLSAIPEGVALGSRLNLKLVRGRVLSQPEVQVSISWVRGTDSVLFESFCGTVKRKLKAK